MESMSYILFICVVAPMASLLLVAEPKMRRGVLFLLIGMYACLFVSEINGLLYKVLDADMFYLTTSVTPVTEELVKSIPVFIFALAISDRQEDLLPVAFFTGIGFAVLENLIHLTQNFSSVTLLWAIGRGFASGLMHGICTGMVGICISFIRKKKKLFYCGILASFDVAIVYHSVFNSLVNAGSLWLNYLAFTLPILTYIPIVILVMRQRKIRNKAAAAA